MTNRLPGRRRAPAAPNRRGPRPLWQVFAAHIVALGLCLVLYALPHHVIHKPADVSTGITSSRSGARAATPEPTEAAEAASLLIRTPEPVQAPVSTPEPVGSFRGKFADRFTSGDVVRTDNTYQSANLNITLTSGFSDELNSAWYIADIYVADISCLITTFRGDDYGHGYNTWPQTAARDTQSIVTINGDYYVLRDGGIVIRNGTLYRDGLNTLDVCVLYWDGTVKTFSADEFNAQNEMNNGAYQCWNFGPTLLDENSQAITDFESFADRNRHPRSCFGYYEPGHYCFVAVDGRNGTSKGAPIEDMAVFMQQLGCKQAYNLDGGQTSMLCAGTTVLNDPYKGGRRCSDYICIVDRVTAS